MGMEIMRLMGAKGVWGAERNILHFYIWHSRIRLQVGKSGAIDTEQL
jgi:hypothetical protein